MMSKILANKQLFVVFIMTHSHFFINRSINMKSYELIKNIRSSLNLTQNEFGNLLGITQQEVSKLEKGLCKLTIDTLMNISDIMPTPIILHISKDNVIPIDVSLISLFSFSTLSSSDQKFITDLISRLSTNTSL